MDTCGILKANTPSFPNDDGILKKILSAFAGENIIIDPALQNFYELERELTSRKYSTKTVKAYLRYNKELINFTGKRSSDIDESDIKNYIYYLVEKKDAATSTLNTAVNALNFYYKKILKKKFMYETNFRIGFAVVRDI